MPILRHHDPVARVFVSVALGRVTPLEITEFLDELERLAKDSPLAAHLHMSDGASADLLQHVELAAVADRARELLRTLPEPWFPNAIVSTTAVQYGVTRMILGLIGGEVPIEVFRSEADAARWAKVDPAVVQASFDAIHPGRERQAT